MWHKNEDGVESAEGRHRVQEEATSSQRRGILESLREQNMTIVFER